MTIETKFITGQAVRFTGSSLSAEDFLREIYKPNEQGLSQRTKLESSILLGGVYSAVSGHDAEARYFKVVKKLEFPLKLLIDSILIYQHVYVPTNDFLILPALINNLDQKSIIHLIESDVIRFVRIEGSFCVLPGSIAGTKFENISTVEPMAALQKLEEVFQQKFDKALYRCINAQTQIIGVDALQDIIALETANDFNHSKYLKKKYSNADIQKLNVNNTVPIITDVFETDHSKSILRDLTNIVNANLEFVLAEKLNCLSLTGIANSAHFAERKMSRLQQSAARIETMEDFYQMEEVPDVAALSMTDNDFFEKLINLRQTNAGREFREMHYAVASSYQEKGFATELNRAYRSLTKQIHPLETMPAKILRLGLFSMPILSNLSILDLLLSRFCSPAAPVRFIEELRQQANKTRPIKI